MFVYMKYIVYFYFKKQLGIMTTLENIKNGINIEELKANDKYNSFEDWSDEEILDATIFSTICAMFRKESKQEVNVYMNASRSGKDVVSSYFIQNENVIETLRNIYKSTKNNFVKSVVTTIGQTKKFSDKQIQIIAEEIMKLNLTLNF